MAEHSRARQLRELLAAPGLILAPGAYDCITARLVAAHGFPAVYLSGGWTAGSFGYPDYGLLTMSEMVDNARRVADAVEVPVIADADTGFGNELNTFRAIREYERAGVAAVHIEDQVFPKRCGHLDGKELVPEADFLAKVRAAADARRDPDFLIIARTDARAVTSFDDAVGRANRALEAGADVAFVEAPQSREEMAAIPRAVNGPCLLNIQHGGKSPPVDQDDAESMGYRIGIIPALLVTAVVGICDALLGEMRESGRQPTLDVPRCLAPIPLTTLFARLGGAAWDPRRTRYR